MYFWGEYALRLHRFVPHEEASFTLLEVLFMVVVVRPQIVASLIIIDDHNMFIVQGTVNTMSL
jgi:hypothetical protein